MTPNPFFARLRALILFLASGRLAVMLLPLVVVILIGVRNLEKGFKRLAGGSDEPEAPTDEERPSF